VINHVINHMINYNNMSRTKLETRNIRKLSKTVRGSYIMTLPVEFIRALRWQDRQKLTISLDKRGKRIIIKDWQK